MGFHPANLALRLFLELACLTAFVAWGASSGGWLGWVGGIGLAAGAMVAWGTFAVPGDRSRSGRAPVPVPGWVRLLVELLFFGGGIAALTAGRWAPLAGILAGLVVLHHLLSYDRIRWLVAQR